MNNTRNEEILKRIGQNLRRIRQEKNMSQQELANTADIELSQVHRIETAKINPTVTTIVLLAEALGVRAGEFF